MKITDYEKVQQLTDTNIFLLDGDKGTKTILAPALAKALVGLMSSQDFISGLNLSELNQMNTFEAGDKILVGTAAGNKSIGASDALFAMLDAFSTVEMRRTIFRGKNLGAVVTAEQKANIQNGSFKGFFLGDYWSIGERIWRIADFNYFINCGDPTVPPNHLVIMPDNSLYTFKMNETDITTGGYVGSKMYTEGLNQAKTLATSAFPDMVFTHRTFLVNAVTNGISSGGAWYDSTLELPNEIMMYGSHIFMPQSSGATIAISHTIYNSQLALMAAHPRFIKTTESYWLMDVVSSAHFANVGTKGVADCSRATNSFGVRPVFAIG